MHRFPLLSFFVLANLFSWLAWAPLAAVGLGWSTHHVSPYLHLVGGLGPMLATLAVTTFREGRPGLLRLARRCTAVRGRAGSLALAIAAPIGLFAVAALALNLSGQGEVAWADVGRSVEYPALSRPVYWLANI